MSTTLSLIVEAMTQALLEWETLDADQINDIMAKFRSGDRPTQEEQALLRQVMGGGQGGGQGGGFGGGFGGEAPPGNVLRM